jgi:hypothetical protein
MFFKKKKSTQNGEQMKNINFARIFTFTCMITSLGCILFGLTSCCNFTMSNTMTEGKATNVGDDSESMKNDPTITPKFSYTSLI